MLVDVVLGLIFITAIICFTVYKINKNSTDKNAKYFTDNKESKYPHSKNESPIGFQSKKKKDEKKNDKD